MRIDIREVVFDPASVADSNGTVFWWRGKVYRAVKGKAAGLYRTLFERGVIEKLIDVGLIETEMTSLSLEDYSLVLSHRTIPFRTYCFEWCDEMLRDAALLTCDLSLTLASFGLSIQDAHCWNILFDGPTPKFVDFGSIVPAEKYSNNLFCWSYEEFQVSFLYPLYLMSAGQGELARRLSFDLNNIVTKQAIIRLLPWTRRVQCRWNDLFNKPHKFQSKELFLQQLVRSIEAIEFPAIRTDWSGYYDDEFPSFEPSKAWNLKQQTIFDILLKTHPTSVVDIGSNKGWYSQLAASMDISVIAFDTDEMCVRMLYADASKSNLSILPIIMDVCSPSPVCTRIAYNESHPPAQDRLKGEMVLALAIVHHLVFKQGLRFDGIVDRLASFTTKWLLVEFVPPTDRYVSKWYSDEFDWYSTQGFVAELERVFFRIEVLNSFPAPRQLLLCER